MSRIKSSVKMGQGRRRRGVALAAAGPGGQFEIAAVTPRRTWAAQAAPGWPPVCKGVRCPAPARGAIPAEMEGSHDCRPRGSGDHRGPRPRLPRSGRPRSTAHHPRGSGDLHSMAPAGAPIWPADVDGEPSAGVGGPPLPGTRGRPAEKGGEMKNKACHLSRNNA